MLAFVVNASNSSASTVSWPDFNDTAATVATMPLYIGCIEPLHLDIPANRQEWRARRYGKSGSWRPKSYAHPS
jgi:hypothetical protein